MVTTKASPGGYTSIHQSASLDIVCDLETSCDALKGAVAILDYRLRHPVLARPQNSPSLDVAQPTGSRTYGFSGGSSRSANGCQAEVRAEFGARVGSDFLPAGAVDGRKGHRASPQRLVGV